MNTINQPRVTYTSLITSVNGKVGDVNLTRSDIGLTSVPIEIGAFGGATFLTGTTNEGTVKTLSQIETDLGCKLDIAHEYYRTVSFSTLSAAQSIFNTNIKPLLDLNKKYILTLMPNDQGAGSSQGVDNLIAIRDGILTAGNQYNTAISNLFNVIKTYGKKGVIIDFMHEANGQSNTKSWNLWNTGNLLNGQPDIASYIQTQQNLFTLAENIGVRSTTDPNTSLVKFVTTFTRQNHNNLNVDNSNAVANSTSNNLKISVINYYVPTTDYIGFNIHNKPFISQESWISFRSWISEYYQIFKRFGKPMLIPEMGCFPSNIIDKPLFSGTTGHAVNDILTFTQSGNTDVIPAKIKITVVSAGNPTQFQVTEPGGFFNSKLPIQVVTSGVGTVSTGVTTNVMASNRLEYIASAFANITRSMPLIQGVCLFLQDKVESIPARWSPQNATERKGYGQLISQTRQRALNYIDFCQATNLLPDWSATSNWTLSNTTIGTNLGGLASNNSASLVPSITFSVLGNGGTPSSQAANLLVDSTKFKQGKNYVAQMLARFVPNDLTDSSDFTIEYTAQQNGGSDPVTGSQMFSKFLVHPSIVERQWVVIKQPINHQIPTRSASNQMRIILYFGHNTIVGTLEVRDYKLFESDEPEMIIEIPPVQSNSPNIYTTNNVNLIANTDFTLTHNLNLSNQNSFDIQIFNQNALITNSIFVQSNDINTITLNSGTNLTNLYITITKLS